MIHKISKLRTMPKALLVIPVATLAIGVWANNTAVCYSTTQNDIDAITTATETYSQPVAKQNTKKPKKQKGSKQKRQKDAKPKKLKDHRAYTVERDSANAK